ncbi:unnamed protein product, partial [Staurois parvus]
MDSALVVGLPCRVGCSTRADQRVLSALVVGLACRVGCSTRADQRVLSALVVELTCRVGCCTRADQRVLLAARSSQSAKPGADYRKVYIRHDQVCALGLGVCFPMSLCTCIPASLLTRL